MIEFSGKIENEIQAKIITKRGQFLGIVGAIMIIVIMLGYLIVWLIDDMSSNFELIITIIFAGVAILLGIILCMPTSRKRLRFEWDYYIKFENEIIKVVSNHQNGVIQNYKISKIKKVIDYGKYYYLFLYRLDPSKGIVCQKDLISFGTLEEFEKLFEGKIKRKIK